MDWSAVLYSFITIGVLLDLLAVILRIRYVLGLNKVDSPANQGMPIGLIFYLLGFLQLIFINEKPLSFAFVVFLCCILFYVFLIFSGMIIDGCITFVRRLRAYSKKVFYSDSAQGIVTKNVVENAVKYVAEGISASDSNLKTIGFVDLKCLRRHWGGWAEIRILASGESVVAIVEDDPGHIRGGIVARELAKNGFPIDHWQINKRRRIVVPKKDYDQIPLFIDALFKGYYGCGDDHQIKAEVLRMSRVQEF
jgi:hypothetical protein